MSNERPSAATTAPAPAPPTDDKPPVAQEAAKPTTAGENARTPSSLATVPEASPAGVRETRADSMAGGDLRDLVQSGAERAPARPSLEESLAKLEVPPPWLAAVTTKYDTSQPWKEARLEIRRLLALGRIETHREAIKLMWIYLCKSDIGDGHEYPMYTFLGGEPVWSIRAHEEFLAKPHENTPIHSHLTLASLYAQYGEFEKAKATLDVAMNGLPGPPWQIMRKADVLDAYGDLYAAWGKIEEAKRCYREAAALYPQAQPPYGGHLLPRRTDQVQSKLDLLTSRSLGTTHLRDGEYRDQALGYAGDIDVVVTVRQGKIVDIHLTHEEKIDQNACVLVPRRIIDAQSLQVDAISGATVTRDAIVHGVYRCLKRAGLQ